MAQSTPDWEALKRSIAGVVELPDAEGYQRASRPFNARFDKVRPLGIVRCGSPFPFEPYPGHLTTDPVRSRPGTAATGPGRPSARARRRPRKRSPSRP